MSLVHRPRGFTAHGVDGCPGGWFVVSLSPDGPPKWRLVQSLGNLVDVVADRDRIFVDIPIGLPHGPDERACDKKARQVLGRPRASSVFRAPVRAVFAASDHAHACSISRAVTAGGGKSGKGITKQTYAIVPKVEEVDTLLRQSAKARNSVREIHPEVCFAALAGQPMRHNKKRREGRNERLGLLRKAWPGVDELVEQVLTETLRKQVSRDDILDAAVAALTAAQPTKRLRHFPVPGPMDEYGLPMQMVVPSETRDDMPASSKRSIRAADDPHEQRPPHCRPDP